MADNLGIEITNEGITFADGIDDLDGCRPPFAEDVKLHQCTSDPEWLLSLFVAEVARVSLKKSDPDVTARQMRAIVAVEIDSLDQHLMQCMRLFSVRVGDAVARVKAHNTSFSGGTKGEEKGCEDA